MQIRVDKENVKQQTVVAHQAKKVWERDPSVSPGGRKEDTVTSTRESVAPTASSADDLSKAEQVGHNHLKRQANWTA